jgi:peptidylprolyl isomerase/FKBP-type peptidyl-prolyl cis-trans isomerase FklB
MRNLFCLFIFVALLASFSGCQSNDNVDGAWQTANANAYDAITKNPKYHELQTETGPTGVYYAELDSGGIKGTEYPLQTSTVKILYQGAYYNGTIFDVGTSLSGVPMEFSLIPYTTVTSSWNYTLFTPVHMCRGLSFALQNMKVGNKWEIWIPYYLGYYSLGGYPISSTSTLFQAYTTLVYTVELVSITQYP